MAASCAVRALPHTRSLFASKAGCGACYLACMRCRHIWSMPPPARHPSPPVALAPQRCRLPSAPGGCCRLLPCSNRKNGGLRPDDIIASSVGERGWAWGPLGTQRRLGSAADACRCRSAHHPLCPRAAGPPHLLLAYRLAMLGWSLFIGVRQVVQKGRRVFVFYTGRPRWPGPAPGGCPLRKPCLAAVHKARCCEIQAVAAVPAPTVAGTRMPLTPPAVWNWWLLTAFFALGSAASLAAWRRRARQRRRAHGAAQPSRGVDWLGNATLATFCVVTPVSAGAAPTACYSRRGWGCGRCLRQRQAAPLPCAAPASRACAEGCQRGRRPPAAWVCRWLCW